MQKFDPYVTEKGLQQLKKLIN